MQDEIRKLRESLKIPQNLENVEFLSKIIIELSNLNIEIGLSSAEAKFEQEKRVIAIMDDSMAEKKMSKTEAESRAIIDTQNSYEALDNERDDLAELVNSIKKRLDVLGWDRRHS